MICLCKYDYASKNGLIFGLYIFLNHFMQDKWALETFSKILILAKTAAFGDTNIIIKIFCFYITNILKYYAKKGANSSLLNI